MCYTCLNMGVIMSTDKEPVKVTRFKAKVYEQNFDVVNDVIVNRLDEIIAKGYRVEYHVDGKVYK